MNRPDPSVVDWQSQPLYLSAAQVAAIYGLTADGVQRLARLGRFVTPAMTHPMRWSRADLERAWNSSTFLANKRRSA